MKYSISCIHLKVDYEEFNNMYISKTLRTKNRIKGVKYHRNSLSYCPRYFPEYYVT
jgi:hypothetical protein